MKLWILMWCVLQGTCGIPHVNICLNAIQSKSIDCSGSEKIIRIDKVFAAYIPYGKNCDETGTPTNPPTECRAWQKEAYYRCQGKRSCTVYPWWANTSVPDCVLSASRQTNCLQIQFSCRMQPTSVWLSMYKSLTGPVIDIFSPGFPYGTPRGPYSFSCSITPADDLYPPIEVDLTIRQNLKLESTSSNEYCLERLFSEYINGPLKTQCSGIGDYHVFNREELWRSVSMFRFTYSTQKDTLGGYFLFEIRGFKNGVPIDLKIDCADLTSILPSPISSSSSSSTTTTTTTITASTTGRTTTGTITATFTSSGTDDKPERTSVNILAETTAGPTLMTSSKDSVLYGVIGALIGIIIIIVIVFFLMKWRKHSRNQNSSSTTNITSADNSAPETTSSATGHLNSVYTDLTTVTDSSKQIYAKLQETKHGRLGEENQHYVNVRESTDVPEDSIDIGNQYTEEDSENGYTDIE